MAYLSRILVYPVKSLEMISISEANLLESGALTDDRRFAILDQLGHYVNGKRNPRVHSLRSRYDHPGRRLFLSESGGEHSRVFHVDSEKAPLERWLSEFFDMPVSFQENTNLGFPDDTESPGPTLISVATLREIARWFDLTIEETRARFRANLEIDGVPPFWEDQLYGSNGTTVRFRIGDVIFDGINPCQRCVVPTRDHSTGVNIPDFARRFVEMRRRHFPEWAESSRFNHYYRLAVNTRLSPISNGRRLFVGDTVEIIGQTGEPMATPAILDGTAQPTRWSGSLRVSKITDNTPTVRTFRFESADGEPFPISHLPGQFINLEIDIDGETHRRCYTISSSPTKSQFIEITVKRENAGTISRSLHDRVQVGDEIKVSGPGGRFTFTEEDASAVLFIAAGVGITPIMSKIRYLTDIRWPHPIHLLYSARTESEMIFSQELSALSGVFPNLRVTTTLTREMGERWPGHRGRINKGMLQDCLPDSANRRVHICGPIEMAASIKEMLKEIGVQDDQVKSEAFGGTPNNLLGDSSNEPVIGAVTFTESGRIEAAHCGQTLLEMVTSAGIPLDRGCLEGICGRCKVKLLSGRVTMDVEDALTNLDRSLGIVLACQAKPVESIAVEL